MEDKGPQLMVQMPEAGAEVAKAADNPPVPAPEFDKSKYPIMPTLSKCPKTGKVITTFHDEASDLIGQLKADIEYWRACAQNGGSLSGKVEMDKLREATYKLMNYSIPEDGYDTEYEDAYDRCHQALTEQSHG